MTKIVFVCTGNTCRSPMAEAILKSKGIDGIEVKSAGIFAYQGEDASPLSKDVLKENHIEIQHQARLFNQMDGEWSDLILTMTKSHKDWIIHEYPDLKEKVYTIKEFVGEGSSDVSDPYGGNKETYKQTYYELQRLIEKLLEKIN